MIPKRLILFIAMACAAMGCAAAVPPTPARNPVAEATPDPQDLSFRTTRCVAVQAALLSDGAVVLPAWWWMLVKRSATSEMATVQSTGECIVVYGLRKQSGWLAFPESIDLSPQARVSAAAGEQLRFTLNVTLRLRSEILQSAAEHLINAMEYGPDKPGDTLVAQLQKLVQDAVNSGAAALAGTLDAQQLVTAGNGEIQPDDLPDEKEAFRLPIRESVVAKVADVRLYIRAVELLDANGHVLAHRDWKPVASYVTEVNRTWHASEDERLHHDVVRWGRPPPQRVPLDRDF